MSNHLRVGDYVRVPVHGVYSVYGPNKDEVMKTHDIFGNISQPKYLSTKDLLIVVELLTDRDIVVAMSENRQFVAYFWSDTLVYVPGIVVLSSAMTESDSDSDSVSVSDYKEL